MTAAAPVTVEQFALLASFIAGRPMGIALTTPGERAYTDGRLVFVAPGDDPAELRRQVLLQSALLGAGSLNPLQVRRLRARSALAHRYLAVEGQRVLSELAQWLPLATEFDVVVGPTATSAEESLQLARSKVRIAAPPDWFGVIKPSRLLVVPPEDRTNVGRNDRWAPADVAAEPEADDEDEDEDGPSGRSTILRLFENPLTNSRALSDLLRKILGTSRGPGDDAAGNELAMGSARRTLSVSADGPPVPTAVRVTDTAGGAVVLGRSVTLHPEWDTFAGRYRPDWCRVIRSPMPGSAGISATSMRDDVLLRQLAKIGLGTRTLRARADGDELDIEALIGVVADARSGDSPPQHVYLERRKLARDLGVLVLLDASGSTTDADPHGRAVHEHQRRAAATLTATLEELGDRVALCAFRSQGRGDVRLLELKTFDQRFGAAARARLNGLQPSGYTRLGAAIRGAAEIVDEAGTAGRLLIVLSDGHPYDHGYEGRYAEADTHRALGELSSRGIAGLCLSLAGATEPAALDGVFGAVAHASAPTLADVSPRLGGLVLSALRAADLR